MAPKSMLSDAETGARVSKEEYREQVPGLRVDLLNAQFDLRSAPFAVVILLVGDDRLGCEEVVDRLNQWMDARYINTHAFMLPTDEEEERPRFWRYWRTLPSKGRTAIFRGGWPLNIIADRVLKKTGDNQFERRIRHAQRFEQALVDDGTLLLKFWLHVPRHELKERLEKAEKDPDTYWRIEEEDWTIYDTYKKAKPVVEHYLIESNHASTPWQVVEGTDKHYRDLTIAKGILSAIQARLQEATDASAHRVASSKDASFTLPNSSLPLDQVDLSVAITKDRYRERLPTLQARVRDLARRARRKMVSSVLVFEGWDAAGKGGAIRRITNALPARDVQVIRIGAPNEQERAQHYLWRFWKQLPRAGRMVIFDRSWYGRVLVERVEGYAREDEWQRAFAEINDFEEQLLEHGIPVMKFWLHIDRDEQSRRFEAREKTPYKKHKITKEDYRNRDRWPDYEMAINEMVLRTSTDHAPWHLVPANDKRLARVSVLETVCQTLGRVFGVTDFE